MSKETIKVGPIKYTVIKVENLRGENGVDLHGEVNYGLMEIRLNEQHTMESEFVTRWHEVLHCLEALYEIKISEKAVTALATGIAQIMQDNPKMNWIRYRENR